MTGSGVLEYKRLRAPRHHGGVLIEPPIAACEQSLSHNLAGTNEYDWQGIGTADLVALARQELAAASADYAAENDISFEWDESSPIVAVGHQPELYHPGVWFKNFVLNHLGANLSANTVNVLIDNDLLRETSIRVPVVSKPVHLQTIPLDEPDVEPIPYECRGVTDLSLFESFGERVQEATTGWCNDPIVAHMWPKAVESLRRHSNLGRALASGRHAAERELGLRHAEVPLSTLCSGRAFSRFVCHLLANAPRLWDVHNAALADYRAVNRVRSRTHPVPDLSAEDQWLEMPFWILSSESPVRRPLYVRAAGAGLELSDLHGSSTTLDLTADGEIEGAIDQLLAAHRSVQIRPRALVTTMYLRLILSDLFIHGIGGAKYDELTDEIVRRFFGLEATDFVVATATTHLPLQPANVSEDDRRDVLLQLRQLDFQPERFTTEFNADAQPWLQQKAEWLAKDLPIGSRRERHLKIVEANESLQLWLSQKRIQLNERRQQIEQALRESTLLTSREYSFCVFPFETLSGLLLELLREGT